MLNISRLIIGDVIPNTYQDEPITGGCNYMKCDDDGGLKGVTSPDTCDSLIPKCSFSGKQYDTGEIYFTK